MNSARIARLFRRSMLLLTQIILISVLGCGPAATPIIIDLPTNTPAPGEATQPPATPFLPTGIPSVTPTTFVPRATVKIFSHGPLTGEQAAIGTDMLRGAELAVQHLHVTLLEYGYKVELVSYDDQNLLATARSNAQQIVDDREILCGIGHYDPAAALSASEIYHLAGLAYIAPTITEPLLTDRDFREVNRLIARADGQGIAAAQFAISQQLTSVYIVSQQDNSSVLNAEYFRRDSGNLGIQLLGMRVGNVTDENREQIVRQIMTANPAMVYISTSADQGIPLLSDLRAAGYTGAFIGTEALHDQGLISLAGAALIQGGPLYYTITNPPAPYYAETEQFIWEYNEKYGEEPLDFAARAYDATGMCLRGIAIAAQATVDVVPTRAEVTRGVRRINNYDGITGRYEFSRQGDPELVQYYMYQVASVDEANWDQNPIVATYEIIPP